MSDVAIIKEKMQRVASLTAHGISDEDIADSTGLSVTMVLQLRETKEYKEAYAAIRAENLDEQLTLNDCYDTVELLAVSTIIDKLRVTRDFDTALKAATMANKAQRRRVGNNQPLDGREGATVVFNLQQNFVEKLNQVHEPADNARSVRMINHDKKQQDFLGAKAVESLLTTPDSETVAVPDFRVEQVATELEDVS